MKHFIMGLLSAALVAGCTSTQHRKQERASAYQNLSPEVKRLVDRGQVEPGMDTNAVYLAWGAPSLVTEDSGSAPRRTIWTYYGNKAVLTHAWAYRPTGYGYWSLESVAQPHSERVTRAEVVFENARVVERKRF